MAESCGRSTCPECKSAEIFFNSSHQPSCGSGLSPACPIVTPWIHGSRIATAPGTFSGKHEEEEALSINGFEDSEDESLATDVTGILPASGLTALTLPKIMWAFDDVEHKIEIGH